LNSPHPLQDQVQVDTPLYFTSADEAYEHVFGGAIMPNTRKRGRPRPTGMSTSTAIDRTWPPARRKRSSRGSRRRTSTRSAPGASGTASTG
jgi:hypothetical protein